MNKKQIVIKKSFYNTLETKNITVKELYELISKDFNGKMKVIYQSPTTAGINAHFNIIDTFLLEYDHDVIRFTGENTGAIFCINDLCNVLYESLINGRPNMSINDQYLQFYFI